VPRRLRDGLRTKEQNQIDNPLPYQPTLAGGFFVMLKYAFQC